MTVSRLWCLLLSPHLDDGVLSCGGRLYRLARSGWRVTIATVFTHDEPRTAPSALASELRRWWNLPAGSIMKTRRQEDETACQRLGCESLYLGFSEAPYRCDASGSALYPTLEALYGPPLETDLDLVAQVGDRLRDFLAADLWLVPLAVGGHVDHRIVRQAAESVRSDLWYYEEFPYLEWKHQAIEAALDRDSRWEIHRLALDELAFQARFEAICDYRSQIPALFRNPARLRRQLRRSLRRTGGERIYRKSSSS